MSVKTEDIRKQQKCYTYNTVTQFHMLYDNKYDRGCNLSVCIHIFVLCPSNFFLNSVVFKVDLKGICRAGHEYMNIHPFPH